MGSARNPLYGLATALLLVSGAAAISRSSVSHLDTMSAAPEPAGDSKAGTPGTSAWTLGGRESSDFSEGESWPDGAPEDGTVERGKRGGAARAENRGRLGSASAAPEGAGPGPVSRDDASATAKGRVNRTPAALANVFSSGSEPGVAPPQSVDSANPVEVREIFISEREDSACQPGARQFMLEDVQGLYACVVWRGLAGAYAQQVTFVSPDGQVYQTLTQAFATAQTPATGTVEVAGRRYEVKPAGWGANGATLVTAALPVAGTYITRYNIAGLWTVRVSLDGQLFGQESFELRPR
jgi:hypothetical protein